jgi:hypothetical protein
MLKNLTRALTVAVAAAGLVLATSQIARADETGNGFCIRQGNGDCLQYNDVPPDILSVSPWSNQSGFAAIQTVGRIGGWDNCNNGKVATMSANGCWWPFTNHQFDTDYHNDVVVELNFPQENIHCASAHTSDHTVIENACTFGYFWVRDGTYGFVSVAQSDADGAHRYLQKSTDGQEEARTGAFAMMTSQWAFCKDTTSGCVNGQ